MSPVIHRPVRLPMYDWPEVASETRFLEATLTDEICFVLAIAPSTLQPWPNDAELYQLWTDPGLLLAQTCGYPLTHKLQGKVTVVGVPEYQAQGCVGPYYCSQIVVAVGSTFQALADLKGSRAVFNGPDSQSGMNALRHAVSRVADGRGFFSSVTETGGHLASMAAVATGSADVAAIDAVCWALAQSERPDLVNRLRVLARSEQAPGLPLVTSRYFAGDARVRIVQAVRDVLTSPQTAKSRERLHIHGFSELTQDDYGVILELEAYASMSGYPDLA